MAKGSSPSAPDYQSLANQQGQINTGAAITNTALNNPNQSNPYGSQTWKYNGDPSKLTAGSTPGGSTFNAAGYQQAVALAQQQGQTIPSVDQFIAQTPGSGPGAQFNPGDWSLNTTLAPAQQGLLDNQNSAKLGASGALGGLAAQLQAAMSKGLSLDGLQQVGSLSNDPNQFSADRDRTSQAAFSQGMTLLGPQYAQQNRALDSKLENQGIGTGTGAYDTAESNQHLQQNVALNNLANQSVMTGNAEQQQLQQQLLAATLGQQTLQGQQLGERQTIQQAPLSNFASLLGLTGPTNPTFGQVQGGQTTPANVAQAGQNQYQAALNSSNASNQASSQNTGALATILAAYLGGKK